ncbi:MAG: nucleotidyltransferase domain-containing protein [Candidatus Helarchaeota archaeon]
MCKLCRKNIITNKELNKKVIKLIHSIKEKLTPSKIIIFGSIIRGDYHELSDLDLIIVGNFKVSFFNRIGLVLDLNTTDLEVEPLVYTLEEFDRMIDHGNLFIKHILEEGIEV